MGMFPGCQSAGGSPPWISYSMVGWGGISTSPSPLPGQSGLSMGWKPPTKPPIPPPKPPSPGAPANWVSPDQRV